MQEQEIEYSAYRAIEKTVGQICQRTAQLAQDASVKKSKAPDNEKAMTELMEILNKAGINAETGLKSIAA